jgi:hypothetical protein
MPPASMSRGQTSAQDEHPRTRRVGCSCRLASRCIASGGLGLPVPVRGERRAFVGPRDGEPELACVAGGAEARTCLRSFPFLAKASRIQHEDRQLLVECLPPGPRGDPAGASCWSGHGGKDLRSSTRRWPLGAASHLRIPRPGPSGWGNPLLLPWVTWEKIPIAADLCRQMAAPSYNPPLLRVLSSLSSVSPPFPHLSPHLLWRAYPSYHPRSLRSST